MTDLSEQDKAAITQLWTEYGRALDRSDPEAIAALYAPDGDMTGIDGSHVEGPSAIASAYAAALEQKYTDLSLSDVELGTPRAVGPGAALMDATWRVHGLELGHLLDPRRLRPRHAEQPGAPRRHGGDRRVRP